jgi:hypothetical protein
MRKPRTKNQKLRLKAAASARRRVDVLLSVVIARAVALPVVERAEVYGSGEEGWDL